MWTDLVQDFVVGLLLIVATFLLGLPGMAWRWLHGRVSAWRLSRQIAAGAFDADVVQKATRCYVRPMYSNLDPAQELEPAHALINARAPLFEMVDRFLQTDFIDQKHMLLFADSGMGKTTFLLNYLDHNYRLFNLKRRKIKLVSLGQSAADGLISSVPVDERPSTDLFLDALDEDPKAIGDVEGRVNELLRLCENYRTVTITCRSQFFRSDQHIPSRTGIARIGPVPLNRTKHYSFFRVYLSPFDDSQVKEYLRKRWPGPFRLTARRKAAAIVGRVPTLSVRPMLLAHMPEVMESERRVDTADDIYDVMVEAWALRESGWIEPRALLVFSRELAVNLYQGRLERGGESATPEEIEQLASEMGVAISPDLVTSRSLLNRTADGRYKFAHRSILEFLVVDALFERQPSEEWQLTDQMWRFFLERMGCWSEAAQLIASICNITVRFVEPERKLGLPTNIGIYKCIHAGFDATNVLKIPCTPSHGTVPARNIGELINDLSLSAFSVESPQLKGIRLIIDPETKGQRRVFVSAWVNSYYAVAELVASPTAIKRALRLGGAGRCEDRIALSATPAPGTNDLTRAVWTMSAPVGPDARSAFEPIDLADLSPELAMELDAEAQTVRVEVLSLLERSDPSPFAQFGLFGIPKSKSTVESRPYVMFGAHLQNAWRYEG